MDASSYPSNEGPTFGYEKDSVSKQLLLDSYYAAKAQDYNHFAPTEFSSGKWEGYYIDQRNESAEFYMSDTVKNGIISGTFGLRFSERAWFSKGNVTGTIKGDSVFLKVVRNITLDTFFLAGKCYKEQKLLPQDHFFQGKFTTSPQVICPGTFFFKLSR